MKRAIKVTIICPIEIEDTEDNSEILEREKEAVGDEIFGTEYLSEFDSLDVEDIGEWEE